MAALKAVCFAVIPRASWARPPNPPPPAQRRRQARGSGNRGSAAAALALRAARRLEERVNLAGPGVAARTVSHAPKPITCRDGEASRNMAHWQPARLRPLGPSTARLATQPKEMRRKSPRLQHTTPFTCASSPTGAPITATAREASLCVQRPLSLDRDRTVHTRWLRWERLQGGKRW